ncbi:MAG: IPTL-CTERM sorting domain-containing protein [Rhodocyclaceae bacterium]|nr:IPTL-CTERM sorting domain-containing protein [Rhodocyclaceae bacterium]
MASDNATSFQVAFQAAIDGDVPALPEWGLILLAGLHGLAVMRSPAPRRNGSGCHSPH